MSYKISNSKFNEILERLSNDYEIYAPVRIKGRGRFSDTDNIRYQKISKVEEIEYKEKSRFSAKEIPFPATETIFNIVGEQLLEPLVKNRKFLVFLRSCDIHAMDKLDSIFLKNGDVQDPYYKRKRDNISYIVMGCNKSFENCFCVSMGTNKTDNYSMGIGFEEDSVKLEVKDSIFFDYFNNLDKIDFKPDFVEENDIVVNLPDGEKIDTSLFNDEMWEEYAKRCIACGRCNFSCPTCSCFTTVDIAYDDNVDNGERRRTWAGCHVDKFTDMAGGHVFRNDYGSRMRFKTMHKIYDFNKRFGSHMCVGCGRCDDQCPEYISFSNCINKVTKKVNDTIKEG